MSAFIFRQLFDAPTCTYTYLLADPTTREGILVDSVEEQRERDLNLIKELDIKLAYILETHLHADHVTGAGKLREALSVETVFGRKAGVGCASILVDDGDTLSFSGHTIQVIATPGHTDGCMSYYIEGMVFTGDALLIRGCGRTDFQEGSSEMLYDSVTQKLFTLPDDTLVYPGHDYRGVMASSIGEEKRWNPRLGGHKSKEEFVAIMNNLKLDPPKRIQEALAANKHCGIKPVPLAEPSLPPISIVDLYHKYQKLASNEVIVDVRTPEEYAAAHVPGSINVPLGDETPHLETLKHYEHIYLYCRSGRRVQMSQVTLNDMGFESVVYVGKAGMPDWINAGYPTEK